MSRPQRLIKNTLWSFTVRVLPLGLYFFTTPFIVSRLGVDAYGIYAMVFLFLGYLGFLNLGLPKAVIKFVTEARAIGNDDDAHCYVVTALLLYLALGFIGGTFLFFMAGWIVNLLNIPADLVTDSLFIFKMSAVILMLSLPIQALIAVPKAVGRFDVSSAIELTIVIMQTLGVVAALIFDGGIREVAIVITLATGIGMLMAAIAAHHLIPLSPIRKGFRTKAAKRLLGFGGFVATDGILIQIATKINGLVIGIFHPISTFAYYSIADTIATRVSSLPMSIAEAIFPVFSELKALEREDLLNVLYLRATRYTVVFTMPFFMLFVVYPDKLLGLWLGAQFAKEGATVLMLLGSAQLVNLWAVTAVAGVRGLNRPGISTQWQAILACLNVILCLILIPPYGILGAAFAWSLGRFILIPLFIHRVAKFLFNFESWNLWKRAFLQPILISIIFLVIAVILRPWMTSLVVLIATLVSLSIMYLVVCFFIAFDSVDRKETLKFVRWQTA